MDTRYGYDGHCAGQRWSGGIELLSTGGSSVSAERDLERRAAASGALAAVVQDDPTQLAERLPVLIEELRTELDRTVPDDEPELRALSRSVRDHLVSSIAHVVTDDPGTITETDEFTTFIDAVTTDLTDRTLRAATKALFACAHERGEDLARTTEALGELAGYPDDVVQAWSAGTLGRLAEEHPDAVTSTADELRDLLDHDDETVQHNTVEALATLVRSRPDAVAPAADELRGLLDHEEVAIQHNAAGVLGRLAGDHPAVVVPAVKDLQALRDHDDEAVRRVATGALARLVRGDAGSG